jgi:hypothetical protein
MTSETKSCCGEARPRSRPPPRTAVVLTVCSRFCCEPPRAALLTPTGCPFVSLPCVALLLPPPLQQDREVCSKCAMPRAEWRVVEEGAEGGGGGAGAAGDEDDEDFDDSD